jgi:hypothetical protein
VSEPANFPSRLEAIVRAVIEDGKGTIAERAMLNEIDALRAELERTRVSLHVEASAADAEATFANELNADVAELRARVAELEGPAGELAGTWRKFVEAEGEKWASNAASLMVPTAPLRALAALLQEPPK